MPKVYIIFIVTIAICFLSTFVILQKSIREVWKIGRRQRKKLKRVRMPALYSITLVEVSLPFVITFLKLLEVVMPRQAQLFHFFTAVWEAMAFYNFLEIIQVYLDGPEGTIHHLSTQPISDKCHGKVWGAPPIGIFCWPCCFRTRLTRRGVFIVKCLVWQFVVWYPILYLMDVFHTTEFENVSYLTITSLIVCMYGLFVLLWATEDALGALRTHRKFWAVKGVLIMNTFVLRCAEVAHKRDIITNWGVSNPAYQDVIPGAWAALITSVALVPLAFLSRSAYPSSEFRLVPIMEARITRAGSSFAVSHRVDAKPTDSLLGDCGEKLYLAEGAGPEVVEDDISLQKVEETTSYYQAPA